jgi:3-(methylthio)propanoyl-CoA dehydrogenase
LDMMAVATAASLLARQQGAAASRLERGDGDPAFLRAKIGTAQFFFDHIVPGALALEVSACCGPDRLFTLSAEELAA